MKRYLIDQAINTKLHNVRTTGQCTHYLYDKLIFDKVKEKFGGRIKCMGTGSAPMKK